MLIGHSMTTESPAANLLSNFHCICNILIAYFLLAYFIPT